MRKYVNDSTALILIDLQQGLTAGAYYGHHRNNPDMEIKILQLLQHFRKSNLQVFHVRHSSQDPRSPLHRESVGFEFIETLSPIADEGIFTKQVNSAFIGTDLEAVLKDEKIKQLIMVGMTTNHCISTSVRMGSNLGFQILLPHDATAAFSHTDWQGTYRSAEEIHLSALAHLDGEFAEIVSVRALLEDA